VLVKWWLLAIPHYIVISFFGFPLVYFLGAILMAAIFGSTFWIMMSPINTDFYQMNQGLQPDKWQVDGGGGSLIAVLVFFAAIALLFTGKYPQSIFKLVVGMNRWVYRVAAYTALMTDEYPPFRLWDD
jgi:hypothetical protein